MAITFEQFMKDQGIDKILTVKAQRVLKEGGYKKNLKTTFTGAVMIDGDFDKMGTVIKDALKEDIEKSNEEVTNNREAKSVLSDASLKYEMPIVRGFGSGLFRVYDDKVESCLKDGTVKWSKRYSEIKDYSYKKGALLLNGHFCFDAKSIFDDEAVFEPFEFQYNDEADKINEYIESHRSEFVLERKRSAEKESLDKRITALLNKWNEVCITELKQYKQQISRDKSFCKYMGYENGILYFADVDWKHKLPDMRSALFLDVLLKHYGEPENWLTTVAVDDVQYFKFEGNLNLAHDVHGEGGGVNVDGAIVGGMLFGGAGAIVGSNLGTDVSITTDIMEYDNRFINLIYYDKIGNTKSMNLPYAMKDALMAIMPEKEFSFIQLNKPKEKPKTTSEADEKIENLKKYKELLDSGILTQEEFDAMKKQILGI